MAPPTTLAFNKATRITSITLAVLLLLITLNALVAFFTPAHAGLLDICDQKFEFSAPVDSNGTYGADNPNVDGVNVSPAGGYAGLGTIDQAYGLSGYFWQDSGYSFCSDSARNPLTTGVGNLLLSMLVSAGQALQGMISFGFSNAIFEILLGDNGVLTSIMRTFHERFWGTWGNFIILISLIYILWSLFAKGLKDAMVKFLWTSAVAAVIASFGTNTWLLGFADWTTDVRTGLAADAATTFTPGGHCDEGVSSAECVSVTISSGVVGPVWAYGAAGSQADAQPVWAVSDSNATGERVGGDTVYYKADNNMDPDGKNLKAVVLPAAGVVPTTNPDGNPSVAEYLRWTQTYTAAETAALKLDERKSLRCSALNAPKPGDLDKSEHEGELCYYKWKVRVALLYGLAASNPSAYQAASGFLGADFRIQGALLSLPVGLATISGASFMGIHLGVLQAEFAILIIAVVVALIASMLRSSPRTMADWLGALGMNTIKAILVAFMLTALIIFSSMVREGILGLFQPGGALSALGGTSIAFQITALIGSAVVFFILIALYIAYFKAIAKLKEKNPNLASADDSSLGTKIRTGTAKSLAFGAGGVATVATGGSMKAAAFAGVKSAQKAPEGANASMLKAVTGGISQGHRSGGKSAAKLAAKDSAKDRMQEGGQLKAAAQPKLNAADQNVKAAEYYRKEAGNHTQKAQAADANARAATSDAQRLEGIATPKMDAQAASTPKGQQLAAAAAQAKAKHATATAQAQAAEDNLNNFLTQTGATVTHAQVTDPGTGKLVTAVTDLSTGDTSYQPAEVYDPDLEKNKVFTQAQAATYDQLVVARDDTEKNEAHAAQAVKLYQQDYDQHLADNRSQALRMSNKQIQTKYGQTNPDLAQEMLTYKANQAQAQKLRATANGYTQQATSHRQNARAAETKATSHANEAVKNLNQAGRTLQQADQKLTPNTTAYKKMSNYKKGDVLEENLGRYDVLAARAKAAGASKQAAPLTTKL